MTARGEEKEGKKLSAYLRELVSHHVADPPGFVFCSLTQGWHHQGLQVLLRQQSGNANTSLHCKQPNRVLMERGYGVSIAILGFDPQRDLDEIAEDRMQTPFGLRRRKKSAYTCSSEARAVKREIMSLFT